MQRWKAAALASVLCSSVLSIWMCRDGLLLSHRLGPALSPLRRPPRTLDARIARLAQCKPLPVAGQMAGSRGGHNGGISGRGHGGLFRWGVGGASLPSGLAGVARGRGWWLRTGWRGVSWLSCHKELGSGPEGTRGPDGD